MSTMDKIAIQNLELISELGENIDDYQLVIDNHFIKESDDKNYEGIFNLKELEYPIYFSFHQILSTIRYSNLYKIEGYRTKELIDLMNESIERIVSILEKTEDDPYNQSLCSIIDDIDDKFIVLRERALTCSIWRIFETFNDYLDTFSDALIEGGKYLYTTNRFEEIFEDDDKEINEKDDEDNEDEENKETGELNPNLVYDIYKKDN